MDNMADRLSETIMASLVVCENGKATDVTTTSSVYLKNNHCTCQEKQHGFIQRHLTMCLDVQLKKFVVMGVESITDVLYSNSLYC